MARPNREAEPAPPEEVAEEFDEGATGLETAECATVAGGTLVEAPEAQLSGLTAVEGGAGAAAAARTGAAGAGTGTAEAGTAAVGAACLCLAAEEDAEDEDEVAGAWLAAALLAALAGGTAAAETGCLGVNAAGVGWPEAGAEALPWLVGVLLWPLAALAADEDDRAPGVDAAAAGWAGRGEAGAASTADVLLVVGGDDEVGACLVERSAAGPTASLAVFAASGPAAVEVDGARLIREMAAPAALTAERAAPLVRDLMLAAAR